MFLPSLTCLTCSNPLSYRPHLVSTGSVPRSTLNKRNLSSLCRSRYLVTSPQPFQFFFPSVGAWDFLKRVQGSDVKVAPRSVLVLVLVDARASSTCIFTDKPFLNAGVDPKEIPLPHEFILNRDLLTELYSSFTEGATPFFTLNWSKYTSFLTFRGGLDPVTDIAHHHLAIAILFLIAGHMYRTNWGIVHGLKDILEAHKGPFIGQGHKGLYEILITSWHAQLSLNLAMLGSLTIVVAHHMYSMPPYPYLATDYGTQLSLFTHHMWIGGFLIVGAVAHASILCFGLYILNDTMIALVRPQDMFLDTAIQLQLVFAQWIQNTHTLAPGATAPGATASTSLTWGGGNLVAVGGKVALLPIPLGTTDFLVHRIHAFTIHVTVLILLKGVLFARSSRLIPDKANLGFRFPCDGPGRRGTCQSDVWGSISDQGAVTYITINGWLRDFLWAQASQRTWLLARTHPFTFRPFATGNAQT
ncbi:hypothetical protein V6N11_048040 [Hibiscus sabdariffa]|uniref:Photosystem I n=1 Tax=Hibiscus sabdariffa TaxID=183260 RepID=A0ABR2NXW3_9ROSI